MDELKLERSILGFVLACKSGSEDDPEEKLNGRENGFSNFLRCISLSRVDFLLNPSGFPVKSEWIFLLNPSGFSVKSNFLSVHFIIPLLQSLQTQSLAKFSCQESNLSFSCICCLPLISSDFFERKKTFNSINFAKICRCKTNEFVVQFHLDIWAQL